MSYWRVNSCVCIYTNEQLPSSEPTGVAMKLGWSHWVVVAAPASQVNLYIKYMHIPHKNSNNYIVVEYINKNVKKNSLLKII